jgi:hypothetical protein
VIGSQPATKAKTFQPIQAPCFRLRPSRLLTDENANKIRALAGPRIYRKGKWENTIEAPDNCAWLVEQELQKLGMPYSLAQNAYYRPELTWPEVRANLLRKGEVKPEALDMIFDYQQDGVVFSANRGSAALWYPGGCLTGDTMIAINRAGKGGKIRLDTLVARWNGTGVFKGVRWDLSITTHAQSMSEDGFMRLNPIVGAYATGEKVVYHLVTASGRSIKATAEHKFWTSEGWKPLSEVRSGHDYVYLTREAHERTPVKPVKPRYRRWRNARFHPHAKFYVRERWGGRDKKYRVKDDVWEFPEHRAVVEASMNGLTTAEYHQRLAQGPVDGLVFLDPEVHVHHKNRDSKDNRLENLEVMRATEHLAEHGRSNNWHHVGIDTTPDLVQSIACLGKQKTYDLSMADPLNNYAANGIVVHNSGKTITMLLALLQVCSAGPLPLVFVTKAAVRGQWASAITQFTNGIEPYVLRPLPDTGDVPEAAMALLAVPGLGAKKIVRLHVELGVCTIADLRAVLADGRLAKLKGFGKKSAAAVESGLHRLRPVTETLDNYVQRMRSERRRPVVVVAWTALRDWWGPLSTLLGGIGGLGMDEIHTGKNAKRQRVKVTPEGEATYEDLGNLSSSASKLARSAKFRIAATATSIKDRLRDLWAQMDLIEPGAWGTFGTWARRYCAATEGTYGGLNTAGVAIEYMDELTDRLSFCVHRVPYEVSHAALVGLKRRESWRLGADELGEGWQPERLRSELKAAKLRGYSAELEVMVAAAASQIREPLVERIRDDIESTPNAKICILDIRHDNVDQLAAALTAGLECEVLCVHGGNTTPETRNKIREYYMNHPGPIVMVATGDSVGTGYDLHDTDVAYLSALPWDPGNLHQWEQRFFRHGMKRSCRLVYCIPVGSVIETIAARILAKMPAVERVTKDMETSSASAVLGGTDDKEKLAREILAVLDSIDGDLLEDD